MAPGAPGWQAEPGRAGGPSAAGPPWVTRSRESHRQALPILGTGTATGFAGRRGYLSNEGRRRRSRGMKPAKLRGMKMPRWLGIVLGVSAALAPLGQTRCATLAVAARACAAAATPRACCHAPAPARPLRGECCDVHLPPGSLPAGVTLAASPAAGLLAAIPAAPLLPAPASPA